MKHTILIASLLATLLAGPLVVPAYAEDASHEAHHPQAAAPTTTTPMMPGMPKTGMVGMRGGNPADMMAMMGNCSADGSLFHALAPTDKNLSVDDARAIVAGQLAASGNKHLRVGKVAELDKDTLAVDVVTADNSLVQQVRIDRHTAAFRPAE
jgi:hypothetical protein